MNIFRELAYILRKTGIALFLFHLFITFSDQGLTQLMQTELNSKNGVGPLIWVYGLISLFLSLLSPLITILLVLAAKQSLGVLQFLGRNLNQLFIEEMRASGKALLWSIPLILPGVWKFIEFTFVPFVVIKDPDYALGKLDALRTSSLITRKYFFRLIGILFLFSVFFPLILTSFDEYKVPWNHLFLAPLIIFIEMCLSILLVLKLSQIFDSYTGGKNGTHIQLETN
ncbi:MAG: hypothetical protein BroJett040_16360 [Oligoflexia bacterium]|nr:MAG: hypothetical protein BroJett040_16360 [Oligoflexia bacterium]